MTSGRRYCNALAAVMKKQRRRAWPLSRLAATPGAITLSGLKHFCWFRPAGPLGWFQERTDGKTPMPLEPGALVSLRGSADATYQVVNVDAFSDNVWVRRWPLRSDRSPTFAVPAAQVDLQLLSSPGR
jgi:hypothetical protein